jgi:hypothetical protein
MRTLLFALLDARFPPWKRKFSLRSTIAGFRRQTGRLTLP